MTTTYIEEIERALDRADWNTIERVAQALLMDESPLFLPIGGMHDFGRDAEILKLQDDVHHRYVAISDREDWDRKIQADVRRVRQAGFTIEEVLYCTPKEIPEGKELDRVRKNLRTAGVELKVADRKWWTTKLQQDSAVVRRVKREELHLAPYRPSPLRTADEFDEYLSGKQSYVLTDVTGRDDLIDAVAKALQPGTAVLLHGNLGSGKTRVAVEAAKRAGAVVVQVGAEADDSLVEALLSRPDCSVVVDDAHLRTQVVDRLAKAHLDPAMKRPSALLLVSWSSSVERVRAAVSDSYAIVSIEVPALPRETLAQILREQFGLGEQDRGAVLTRSEGLPLFAILGALALSSGASREQVASENPLEAWFERVWPGRVPEGDAELLAIIAMRGGLRLVDHEGDFTPEAEKAANAAGVRPQALRAHFDPYLDAGLLGYEDGRYVMSPDALAQLVIKRVCFASRPLVAAAKPLVEAAVTFVEAFSRVSQLFDRIADEIGSDTPRRVLLRLLDESVPKPDAEAAEWFGFLSYAKDIATFSPRKALEFARAALAATPQPSTQPPLRDAYSREGLLRKVRDVGQAALFGGTAADFRTALMLLLDLAANEPLIHDLTGLSQGRAPTMHDLLQLTERFNPRQPYAIRAEMLAALCEWWGADRAERSDRVLLLLTRLLDPAVMSTTMDVDKPHQVNISAGFLDSAGYADFAGTVASRIEQVLPSATNEGARAVLSQLEDVVRAARGFPGAFDTRPSSELQTAARDVACRVLAVVAKTFGSSGGFMVKVREMQTDAGCNEVAPVPPETGDIEELFTWERSKDWEVARAERFEALEKLAATLDGMPVEAVAEWLSVRARMARDAGLDTTTMFAMRFVEILGERRPDEAVALARLLVADDNSAQLAERPLIHVEVVWDKGGRELLNAWLEGTDRERWAVWSLLARVHSSEKTPTPQMQLLLRALATARDDDLGIANMLKTILVRLSGGPDATHVLGAALRSPSRIVRRVAAMRGCLGPAEHTFHIPVRPEDRDAFEKSFQETAVPLDSDPTGGMLAASDETLSEVIEYETVLAEAWLKARLQRLADDPGHYVEPFSHGETEALQSTNGRLDGTSLLDDYAGLEKPSYFQRNAYETVLRTLVADLPDAVRKRIRRGDLTSERVYRLLRLVPEGPGWPELILAASQYMSEDDLFSAVYDATFHRGVTTGSRVPVAERKQKFFEEVASHPNQMVAAIGRKLAEHYRKDAERTRREEFREDYER